MSDYHYLDPQSARAIERRTGKTSQKRLPDPIADEETLPLLGTADTDVVEGMLGTFTLQENKPDALEDSSDTRDAYALCGIKQDEHCELIRFAGKNSGGYWGARPCSSQGTSSEIDAINSCICKVIKLLTREITLSDHGDEEYQSGTTMSERISEVSSSCGCADNVTCGGCEMPRTVDLTFSGFVDQQVDTGGPAFVRFIVSFSDLNGETLQLTEPSSTTASPTPGCAYLGQEVPDFPASPLALTSPIEITFRAETKDDPFWPDGTLLREVQLLVHDVAWLWYDTSTQKWKVRISYYEPFPTAPPVTSGGVEIGIGESVLSLDCGDLIGSHDAVASAVWGPAPADKLTNTGTLAISDATPPPPPPLPDTPAVESPVRWKGDWSAGTYVSKDMVRNGQYIMIANTTTTDEAHPSSADWDEVTPATGPSFSNGFDEGHY